MDSVINQILNEIKTKILSDSDPEYPNDSAFKVQKSNKNVWKITDGDTTWVVNLSKSTKLKKDEPEQDEE